MTQAIATGRSPQLTATPRSVGEHIINSSVAWLILNAIWAFSDLLVVLFPSGGRPYGPSTWIEHLVFLLLGFAAIWCMHRTGFPAAWDARIPVSRRIWVPVLTGLVLGVISVVSDLITQSSVILARVLGTPFNVAFPGSLFASVGGSVIWEAFFLIIPLPILLWLISSVILRGRGQSQTFWVLAVISALAEPALQGGSLMFIAQGAISIPAFAAYVVQGFALNFAAAAYFRWYGLLAAVLVRLGYYLIWHVGYGYFTQ